MNAVRGEVSEVFSERFKEAALAEHKVFVEKVMLQDDGDDDVDDQEYEGR